MYSFIFKMRENRPCWNYGLSEPENGAKRTADLRCDGAGCGGLDPGREGRCWREPRDAAWLDP